MSKKSNRPEQDAPRQLAILVIGEGVTDVGRIPRDRAEKMKPGDEAAIPGIVRQLMNSWDLSFHGRTWNDLVSIGKRNPRGVRQTDRGYHQKLALALAILPQLRVNAVIAVADGDKPRYYDDRRKSLQMGRDRLREKNVACAVGLAIPEVEAWLLADVAALNEVLAANPKIDQPPDPESLHGEEGTDRNAKTYLENLIGLHRHPTPMKEKFPGIYQELAIKANVQQIAERCPKGFAPFAEQVGKMTEEISGSIAGG